ncbi:MAG TPA: hypothetical protein VKA41_08440 [Solirubrobacterales bacterium]|nr:hypothetical protein [Solirubrobacterales bacterium]
MPSKRSWWWRTTGPISPEHSADSLQDALALERVAPRASRSRAKIAIRPRRGGTSSDAHGSVAAAKAARSPTGARRASTL